MTAPEAATIDQSGTPSRNQPGTELPSDSAAALAEILDRYLADLQAGQAPDRGQLLARHPELASQLQACLAGIEFVSRATAAEAQEPATLGEFRILRELGRGGMGVVYEAEQTSLRRHVALKVLRFGVVADAEAMQRFHREAETVARLHHTNIVPIFAIGCEQGVHYYAMQLIAGSSLADVLDQSQRSGKPLGSEEVARWGLQAAEALAHAHQRGVIHRDIKPSNLLLDGEGVVWLTDFGLAKRADEATLTLSGALMGTPRYMSPEQAEALRHPIDHRTDVYSLGATLYELATGRPVFESSSPHGVIARILTEEPARPRQIRRDLPRDWETILLTCLAKDPEQRYPTARALADDLRAALDGRPIRARRGRWLTRATRYVRKRKKALTAGTLIVVATVLLMIGAFAGWRFYADWRMGRIILTTGGPPLTAEILPASGDEPIGEPFDVGTRTVRSLPAGDYRLRVKGTGLLGQTYRLAINQGETQAYTLSLVENLLLGERSIPYQMAGEPLVLSQGKTDFIEWSRQTLLRRDGATGKTIWDASGPVLVETFARVRRFSRSGAETPPGKLVQPAPDLDGDGTGDIVLAFSSTPSLLALSGKDGSTLWTYLPQHQGLGGPDPIDWEELVYGGKVTDLVANPAQRKPVPPVPRIGRVLGMPVAVNIDGDGIPDLIAEFFVLDDSSGTAIGPDGPGWRVVAAISGRSGQGLWTRALDASPNPLPSGTSDSTLTVIPGRNGPMLVMVEGSQWEQLDPATGRTRGRMLNFGFVPAQPVEHADLDGDGTPDVLALEPGQGEPLTVPILAAFSSVTGKRLWADKVMAWYKPQTGMPAGEWLLAEDLDRDGRAEVIVPHLDSLRYPTNSVLYKGLRMLDGATGQTRWVRPLWSAGVTFATDMVFHLLAGPDLDGDGTRDLVAVSRYDGRNPNTYSMGQPLDRQRIYVDALSGKDGHPLWYWHADVTDYSSPRVWPLRWWGRGPDGWPMLVVPLGGALPGKAEPARPRYHPLPPVVHLLASSTGHEVHTIDGLSWPRLADLDGDGLDDLWGSVDGKLRAFRAGPPEAWRSLDRFAPAGDLDGDGLADVVTPVRETLADPGNAGTGSRTALARSGRDGRMLWKTHLDPWEGQLDGDAWFGPGREARYRLSTFPLPGGDLDGDGAPDVVVVHHERVIHHERARADRGPPRLPIQVLSGRSGRRLWSAGSLPPLGFAGSGASYVDGIDVYVDGIDVRAEDGPGPAALLVLHDARVDKGSSPAAGALALQTRLARLSGRDGRVVWDVLLADHPQGISRMMGFQHEFGDLDGDGGLEVVLRPYATGNVGPTAFELRALSFRDGQVLWNHPIQDLNATFKVGDLDGDGRAEVVVRDQPPGGGQAAIELRVLDGRQGATRWTWWGGDILAPTNRNPSLCLADFGGNGRREVCLNFGIGGGRRVVILDAQGRQRLARDLGPEPMGALTCADLDGDGRDELLL